MVVFLLLFGLSGLFGLLGLLRFGSSFLGDALANDGKNPLEGLERNKMVSHTSRESEAGTMASDSSGCNNNERRRIENEDLQDSGNAEGKGIRIYR